MSYRRPRIPWLDHTGTSGNCNESNFLGKLITVIIETFILVSFPSLPRLPFLLTRRLLFHSFLKIEIVEYWLLRFLRSSWCWVTSVTVTSPPGLDNS